MPVKRNFRYGWGRLMDRRVPTQKGSWINNHKKRLLNNKKKMKKFIKSCLLRVILVILVYLFDIGCVFIVCSIVLLLQKRFGLAIPCESNHLFGSLLKTELESWSLFSMMKFAKCSLSKSNVPFVRRFFLRLRFVFTHLGAFFRFNKALSTHLVVFLGMFL